MLFSPPLTLLNNPLAVLRTPPLTLAKQPAGSVIKSSSDACSDAFDGVPLTCHEAAKSGVAEPITAPDYQIVRPAVRSPGLSGEGMPGGGLPPGPKMGRPSVESPVKGKFGSSS